MEPMTDHAQALLIYENRNLEGNTNFDNAKKAKCGWGSGWFTATLIKVYSFFKGATIADTLYQELLRDTLAPETLRWFSPEQINALRSKLTPGDATTGNKANEVFEKAIGFVDTQDHSDPKWDALLLAYDKITELPSPPPRDTIIFDQEEDRPLPPTPDTADTGKQGISGKVEGAPSDEGGPQPKPALTLEEQLKARRPLKHVNKEAKEPEPEPVQEPSKAAAPNPFAQAAQLGPKALQKREHSWQKQSPSSRIKDSNMPITPISDINWSKEDKWQTGFDRLIKDVFPQKQETKPPNVNNVQQLVNILSNAPKGMRIDAFKLCSPSLQLFTIERMWNAKGEKAEKAKELKELAKEFIPAFIDNARGNEDIKTYIANFKEDEIFKDLYQSLLNELS